MTKAELESKHIAELHALAAEAGVPGYRMLRREDLVEKLLYGKAGGEEKPPREKRERPPRQRRERPAREPKVERSEPQSESRKPEPRAPEAASPAARPEVGREPEAGTGLGAAAGDEPTRPRRRRRRRRFGRKSKGLRITDLLTPPPGRQALVYGESSAACTALLREVAGELAGASEGPDPIALLVDPSPEELADWKREAPQAEIVAAGQARHASDALAQAARRAEAGEDVILLVDSLTKLAESFDDPDTAKKIFDGAATSQANGSLTVVAALERPA
ncbi:MAG TPA: Rho termination factor N-terminal domain-containing protein [Solirubrobacterales bacterium]|nr:Rho termination factor N-terminal domain-containing protein [Solirubrobacterales bacterium]